MKILSWNMAHRKEAWDYLLDCDVDLALLQEAGEPPKNVASKIAFDNEPWVTSELNSQRHWRTVIIQKSNNVKIKWLKPSQLGATYSGDFIVSQKGTLSVAEINDGKDKPFMVMSMYGLWETPNKYAQGNWSYADASVHRLISDISAFIGTRRQHRIITSGDLNILYGYGEYPSEYWWGRYCSIFQRMNSLGLKFVGPQSPNGYQTAPWPKELPLESKNVPTYYHSRQTPHTASRQLDFVFASEIISKHLRVKAINNPENWGPSDHCQVLIEIK